ncbi:hypothetical protein CBR_g34193 [Chara braunii]|uniref:Uncharacterized protein n=1 Tax=Chara braunii TaxID=69332 RepID=A0A388LIE9_CHABU|nr:hypothetical protein CBR_g34193 [Chara braunii]|eukprot:GBG82013.1 hypothetical protein CBR_g34193 [Chara braunii]
MFFAFNWQNWKMPWQVPRLLVLCKKPQQNLPYHVTVITPPPRSLGVHAFPPNIQCGETVHVEEEPYIVSAVTYRYQLRRGQYEQKQKLLEVQTTSRYIVNLFLEQVLQNS